MASDRELFCVIMDHVFVSGIHSNPRSMFRETDLARRKFRVAFPELIGSATDVFPNMSDAAIFWHRMMRGPVDE